MPVLKKSGLDEASPSSYRPISNLSVISKLLERLVARQFVAYLNATRLLPTTQSGFRRGHSTETAIIRVLSDLDAVDRDDTAILVLLDLSAAFDTVDNGILLERLRVTFGVDDTALAWFRSYLLCGRKQHVCCGSKCSDLVDVICSVPQGSVLGPILFIIYTANLESIVSEHGLSLHQYADDSQIYGSCQPLAVPSLSFTVSQCVDSVSSWMSSNRLQLNADKTEVMWCTSARKKSQCPNSPLPLPALLFSRLKPFETWEFTSTATWVHPHTCAEQYLVASPAATPASIC